MENKNKRSREWRVRRTRDGEYRVWRLRVRDWGSVENESNRWREWRVEKKNKRWREWRVWRTRIRDGGSGECGEQE